MQTDTEQPPAQTDQQNAVTPAVDSDISIQELHQNPQTKKQTPIMLIVLLLLFVLSFGAAMIIRMTMEGQDVGMTTPPEPEPSITEDMMNPIATTSAFLTLEEDVGAFRDIVRSFSAKDPLYVPPDVGVDFDFSNP